LRLAAISTFVGSRRGTQRVLAELREHVARTYHCEIHFHAQLAENLEAAPPNSEPSAESGAILWHKPHNAFSAFECRKRSECEPFVRISD
jgi:hypothetical protein